MYVLLFQFRISVQHFLKKKFFRNELVQNLKIYLNLEFKIPRFTYLFHVSWQMVHRMWQVIIMAVLSFSVYDRLLVYAS